MNRAFSSLDTTNEAKLSALSFDFVPRMTKGVEKCCLGMKVTAPLDWSVEYPVRARAAAVTSCCVNLFTPSVMSSMNSRAKLSLGDWM